MVKYMGLLDIYPPFIVRFQISNTPGFLHDVYVLRYMLGYVKRGSIHPCSSCSKKIPALSRASSMLLLF